MKQYKKTFIFILTAFTIYYSIINYVFANRKFLENLKLNRNHYSQFSKIGSAHTNELRKNLINPIKHISLKSKSFAGIIYFSDIEENSKDVMLISYLAISLLVIITLSISLYQLSKKIKIGKSDLEIGNLNSSEVLRSKNKLKNSEDIFAKVFYSVSVPIVISQVNDGKIIEVNASFTKVSGYAREEVIGKFSKDFNLWINFEDYEKLVACLMEKKCIENFAVNLRVKNGIILHLLISATIISLNGNDCILGEYRDITEIIEKEKLLRESEIRYKRLYESANDAIFILDRTKIIDCNFKALKMFGYSKEEIIEKSIIGFSPNYEVENLKLASETKEKVKKCLEGIPQYFDWKHVKSDGSEFDAEVSIAKFDISNHEYLLAIVRDVTETKTKTKELKESKEKFLKIFRSNPIPTFIVTLDEGIIVNVNDQIEDIAGYSVKEVINKKISDINFWEISEERAKYVTLLKEKGRLVNYLVHYRRKNGEIFPALISAELLEINNEKVIIGSFVDITELKRNEQNLKTALEELEKLKSKLQNENIYLKEEIKLVHNFSSIITDNKAFKNVLKKIEQVATTDATVLILGETGTGKELIARSIHEISERSENPLINVNCASLPYNLVESELFGHVKGSFTGAIKDKIGKFELANNGTIFLDEIGELPLEVQTKLLRVLQENEIERLGSAKTMKIDVRVIAATNRNLEKMVKENKFREDLYYRLNVFPITTIPLRERKEDIPLLLNYFVKEFNLKFGKKVTQIPNYTLEKLQKYSWPGNVREFQNVIERAIILSNSDTLILDISENTSVIPNNENKQQTLREMEITQIKLALNLCNWKIEGEEGAAIRLGIPPSTLRDKIKKYQIKKLSSQ